MLPHKISLFSLLTAVCLLPLALPVAAATGKVFNVTQTGVIGDGTTLDTTAIQNVIDQCAAAGGGTVDFPAGHYLTGTIQIKSGVTLRLEDNAVLLGSTNPADYRNLAPFMDGSGNPMGYALMIARDASHVGIEGSGTIDGQGPALSRQEKSFTIRPFLVRWVRCADVTVQGVHLTNPGAWTMDFDEARHVRVNGVTIRTRQSHLHNNDGIDIDSSQDVQVRACDVDSEDDALVIKSTRPESCRDITATDCTLSSHTNAIKIGTESYGGFDHISISHCQVHDTNMAGIAVYEVDGGDLRHVTIRDITIDGAEAAISIRLGARLKTFHSGETPKPVGSLHDVTIQNVTAQDIKLIGILINGIPGHPVQNLTLKNIQLTLPGGGTAAQAAVQLPEKISTYPEYNMFGRNLPAYGLYARHVQGLTLQNVHLNLLQPDARPAAVFLDVHALHLSDVTPPGFAGAASVPESTP